MKWFRRHIGLGSRLALFALAIQFGLAFGHSHVFATKAHAQAIPVSAGIIADAVIAEYGAAAQLPLDDHDHPPLIDICAICAVVTMAASAMFSASPILHLPEAVTLLYRVTDAGFAHLDPARHPFQPRGPPTT